MRRWLPCVLALAATAASVQVAHAEERDVRLVVIEAAERHGANPAELLRVVNCESRFDPRAVGDGGTSFGLVQLSSLPTGLLGHFHRQGYTDPMDAWQAADYLARVASGEWERQGVGLWRWSCYWRREQ